MGGYNRSNQGYNSIYWIIAIIFLPDQLESTPIEYEEVDSYNDVICDIIDTQIMYQLLDGVNEITQLCEAARFGSDDDAIRFAVYMRGVEEDFIINDITPLKALSSYLQMVRYSQNECKDIAAINTVGTQMESSIVKMATCFNHVADKYGEFAAIEMGIPDYYNP